jgi:hypothetical protein
MSVLAELKEIEKRFLNEGEEGEEEENVDDQGDRKDPKPTLKKDKKKDDQEDKKTNKVSQEEANYIDLSSDPDKHCSSCVQFLTPNSCNKVDGEVDSDGVCRFFERREKKE